MKKIIKVSVWLAAFFAALCSFGYAQTGYTTVTGANVGASGAKASSATSYWQPMASATGPIGAARISTSGGQVLGVPFAIPVIGGTILGAVPALDPTAAGTNLVPDPVIVSFSAWSNPGAAWSIGANNGIGSAAHSALFNTLIASSAASATGQFSASASIPVTPGQSYILGGYIDARQVTGANQPIWDVQGLSGGTALLLASAGQTPGAQGFVYAAFQVPSGVTSVTVSASVNNAVINSGNSIYFSGPVLQSGSNQVPDALATNPTICYAVTVIDNVSGSTLLGAGLSPDQTHVNAGGPYGCVQPTGSTWSFDSYTPSAIPAAVVVTGPTGPTGPTGAPGTASAAGPSGTVQVSDGAGHLSAAVPDATVNTANGQLQADSVVSTVTNSMVNFGDSISAYQGATANQYGYTSLIAQDYGIAVSGLPPNMQAVSGDNVQDQTWHIFTTLNPGDSGNPIVTAMIGYNNQSSQTGFSPVLLAGYAWAGMSSTNKILAGNAAVTGTGTRVADTTFANANGVTCTAGPCTLTYTALVGTPQFFYLWYKEAASGANISVTVDGSAVTDTVTGLSTISTIWPVAGSHQSSTVGLARYPASNIGTAASHTIVVTMQTGATVLGFGFPPTTRYRGLGAPRVIVGMVTPAQNNAYLTLQAQVNALILAAIRTLVADGLNVPLVNTTTLDPVLDMAGTATQNCPASTNPGAHPNNCGHRILANLFESVIGAVPSPSTFPSSVSGAPAMVNTNPGSTLPSANTYAPGLLFYGGSQPWGEAMASVAAGDYYWDFFVHQGGSTGGWRFCGYTTGTPTPALSGYYCSTLPVPTANGSVAATSAVNVFTQPGNSSPGWDFGGNVAGYGGYPLFTYHVGGSGAGIVAGPLNTQIAFTTNTAASESLGTCTIASGQEYVSSCTPWFTASAGGGNLAVGFYQEVLTTPASSAATCTAGQFTDDANYHYVCTATNTWKRVALATF